MGVARLVRRRGTAGRGDQDEAVAVDSRVAGIVEGQISGSGASFDHAQSIGVFEERRGLSRHPPGRVGEERDPLIRPGEARERADHAAEDLAQRLDEAVGRTRTPAREIQQIEPILEDQRVVHRAALFVRPVPVDLCVELGEQGRALRAPTIRVFALEEEPRPDDPDPVREQVIGLEPDLEPARQGLRLIGHRPDHATPESFVRRQRARREQELPPRQQP